MLMRILWYSVSYWSSGVVRGCGRQKAGAFINLAAYYLAGIPSAFVFAFVWHLGGMASVLPCWPLQHFILGLHYFPFILQLFFYIYFELDIGSESWFFNLNSEQGLWFGIMCGLVVQMLLLLSITLFTNWNKEVSSSSLYLQCKWFSCYFHLSFWIDVVCSSWVNFFRRWRRKTEFPVLLFLWTLQQHEVV